MPILYNGGGDSISAQKKPKVAKKLKKTIKGKPVAPAVPSAVGQVGIFGPTPAPVPTPTLTPTPPFPTPTPTPYQLGQTAGLYGAVPPATGIATGQVGIFPQQVTPRAAVDMFGRPIVGPSGGTQTPFNPLKGELTWQEAIAVGALSLAAPPLAGIVTSAIAREQGGVGPALGIRRPTPTPTPALKPTPSAGGPPLQITTATGPASLGATPSSPVAYVQNLSTTPLYRGAQLTGEAIFNYGARPDAISIDVARLLPFRPTSDQYKAAFLQAFGVEGFNSADDFLWALGYRPDPDNPGRWIAYDPISVGVGPGNGAGRGGGGGGGIGRIGGRIGSAIGGGSRG